MVNPSKIHYSNIIYIQREREILSLFVKGERISVTFIFKISTLRIIMLLKRESVSELLECSIETVNSMIESKKLNTVEKYGELKVEYNSVLIYMSKKSNVVINYFDTEKEIISDYLSDKTIKEISDYNSVIIKKYTDMEFINENSFVVNPIVNCDKVSIQPDIWLNKNGFSRDKIYEITSELNFIFKNYQYLFKDILDNTQYYYHKIDISDFSIIEIGNIIIVFHLDLHNGLGITINSMWNKVDIKLKKEFPLSISMKI